MFFPYSVCLSQQQTPRQEGASQLNPAPSPSPLLPPSPPSPPSSTRDTETDLPNPTSTPSLWVCSEQQRTSSCVPVTCQCHCKLRLPPVTHLTDRTVTAETPLCSRLSEGTRGQKTSSFSQAVPFCWLSVRPPTFLAVSQL